jgi:hypothetical protein
MKRKKALLSKKCVMSADDVFGDRRYRYKAWWCLSPLERKAVSSRYPYNTPGIPDSAFAYPVTKDGKLPKGRGAHRALLWSYGHVKKRVAKHKAGSR